MLRPIISFLLLAAGMIADHLWQPAFFTGFLRLAWYLLAYLPVGLPVIRKAVKTLLKGDLFTEFFLMSIATLGAFAIGEYPEGVAVMLFYTVGELFQDAAVGKAKRSISALLDVRSASATVFREGAYSTVNPEEVAIGETLQVKVGERVPLDGSLLSPVSSFNTVALTGESKPRTIREGGQVLAGMINMNQVIEMQANRKFEDSSISRILEMVKNAIARKAKTEQFIRRFARVYTPIVTCMAIALVFLPWFFVPDYEFEDWLYRGLIFLVISCPCALVVSIPLGYFGGIGAASRRGILFKGSAYLDRITNVNTVILDKTGTLTEGVFGVREMVVKTGEPAAAAAGADQQAPGFLQLVTALESHSNHPVALAVTRYGKENGADFSTIRVESVEEIPGQGLKGLANGSEILAGNTALLRNHGIAADPALEDIKGSVVVVAINRQYAGYLLVDDKIKEDAPAAIRALRSAGIKETIMLSGDRASVAADVAARLGIDRYYGDLLPDEKVRQIEALKKDPSRVIAFAGDGINDAPALALSDVGIAMGGLGSDAAIETADVVIQTDQPSRIATAIRIGKATKRIVWQNISLAFGVKALVLLLGAAGLASMWGAVFADVGVALLAIANAVRIQHKDFDR
ncbi:Cd2+/Zn2+-exporting ATPase [Anseongella ginsenosidimutans]|uniref:P-type Zn(2+) transporter n=1 Tax=Anseongella ginsenosidimutans TaxID=496056 RepID=A0A4R3KQJ8_9SPHI|nr:heavy metal translocating P-type ATPase [Anseongella ginsenosidimutans]QEC52573.1 cadmium-translocating P-type ATPase [Anseongella ginsenosidimutans]TCS86489.1 Cd2+/Zn2+-exporting ATPase [Anseongella ginsenosidimutans]